MASVDPVCIPAPPSKSLSHRALIGAALARGTSLRGGVLESDDLLRTIDVLRGCGAGIERMEPGEYRVTGLGGAPLGGEHEALSCFVGESGTSCRLLGAVLAAGKGLFRIHGAGRMHARPMAELTDALESLGVRFWFEGTKGHAPFVMETDGLHGEHLPGGWLRIGCDESSQYLSGLLLAAPVSASGLRILLGGKKAVSWPYVGLTLQTLEEYGVPVTVETLVQGEQGDAWVQSDWRLVRRAEPGRVRFSVPPGGYTAAQGQVEGDYSGASYFLAAGALGSRPVSMSGLRPDSLQGDMSMLSLLARMGAGVKWKGGVVAVSPAPLTGIDADMGDCPDLVPTMAVLAARAAGPTRIRNVAHLRVKESDRLVAIVTELTKTGCLVEEKADGLRILPPVTAGDSGTRDVYFSCHGDHRMAMSLALLELAGDIRVILDDPACVAKSFPDFWALWKLLCPQSRAGGAQ